MYAKLGTTLSPKSREIVVVGIYIVATRSGFVSHFTLVLFVK